MVYYIFFLNFSMCPRLGIGMVTLVHRLALNPLSHNSQGWILFSSRCSDWLFFASICSKSLIWFLVSSTTLVFPCKLFFISISVSFISAWIFLCCWGLHLSIFVTTVLNFGYYILLISVSFASFSGVLIWSFIHAPFFVSSFGQLPSVCFYVLGRAALTLCLGSVA